MIHGTRVAVVVPAFNEADHIARTLVTIPAAVDVVIVVDDASSDGTAAVAMASGDPRVRVIRRDRNGGVGAAIVTGYRAFLEGAGDICVVMAGDGQMDPADLDALVRPVSTGEAGYAKGNRLAHPAVFRAMPKARLVGNIVFSLLTKVASGYWSVMDSQCGYTAVARDVLTRLDLDALYARYGFPNDMLVRLADARVAVADVTVRPVYAGEVSGINPWITVPRILGLLGRGLAWRLGRRLARRGRGPARRHDPLLAGVRRGERAAAEP